jgi:hypothetical protein
MAVLFILWRVGKSMSIVIPPGPYHLFSPFSRLTNYNTQWKNFLIYPASEPEIPALSLPQIFPDHPGITWWHHAVWADGPVMISRHSAVEGAYRAPLKHGTAAQSFLAIHLLPLGDLPSFWQNLKFARCSNCNIFDFRHSNLIAVQNRGHSSAYTVCTQVPFAVTRDELTGHHIVVQPIRCSAMQRRFAASPRT